MIIEVHMLQTHSASNPNRDDIGAPKRTIFGGAPRMRISSQCIKRSIRTSDLFKSPLQGHTGTRTVFFPDLVKEALLSSGIPEEDHPAIVRKCESIAQEEKKAAKPVDDDETESQITDDRPRTAQLVFLSPTEAKEFVKELAILRTELPDAYREFVGGDAKPKKKDKDALITRLRGVFKHDAADIALFGRMTTSDYFENVEAAMQVAHAFSTDAVVPEVDYYTAVDDLPTPGATGSAFLAEFQFASATFYKYFSLNVDLLRANLGDDDELVKKSVAAFLSAAAQAIPSGKRNSFANNNLPDVIFVEVRDKNIPTSYANAFLDPAKNYSDSGANYTVLQDSMRKLRAYAARIGQGYGLAGKRWWFAIEKMPPMTSEDDQLKDEITEVRGLDDLVASVGDALGAPAHA
jgi:CRISPR system Cascade subunit CasC